MWNNPASTLAGLQACSRCVTTASYDSLELEPRWLSALGVGLALLLVSGAPIAQDTGLSLRAAWVTRWALRSAEDVRTLLARLAEVGVNTVFFQVRGAADAFYRSSYEPWSDLLTGTLGEDPGWDPLRVAVREGHRLGLEVHAWVNVFTAFPDHRLGESAAADRPIHPMLAHPEWVARTKIRHADAHPEVGDRGQLRFLQPHQRETCRTTSSTSSMR